MKFQKRLINKPESIEKHELIAVIGLYDTPVTPPHPLIPKYNRIELAFNPIHDKIQVYITSKNKKGLDDFRQDYPNAEIRETAVLENPDEWKRLAYPAEPIADEATPLDTYYQVRDKEDRHQEKIELQLKNNSNLS